MGSYHDYGNFVKKAQYHVTFEACQYDGSSKDSFNTEAELLAFANQRKEWYRFEVIYGIALDLIPEVMVTTWGLSDE
jgi:hypothetical protein